MTEILTIQLSNGRSVDISTDEWPERAASTFASLRSNGYWTWTMIVRQDSDGRVIAYVQEQSPDGTVTASGKDFEVMPSNIEHELTVLAARYELPSLLTESCSKRLRKQ